MSLLPPCPLGENVLDASEESFGPIIERTTTKIGEPAYQIDRLTECRDIIRREINARKRGKPHTGTQDLARADRQRDKDALCRPRARTAISKGEREKRRPQR